MSISILKKTESTLEYRLKLSPKTGGIYLFRWTSQLSHSLSLSLSLSPCFCLCLCFYTHTHTHTPLHTHTHRPYLDEIDQALIYTSQFHSLLSPLDYTKLPFPAVKCLYSTATIGKFPAKFCSSERSSSFSADEVHSPRRTCFAKHYLSCDSLSNMLSRSLFQAGWHKEEISHFWPNVPPVSYSNKRAIKGNETIYVTIFKLRCMTFIAHGESS